RFRQDAHLRPLVLVAHTPPRGQGSQALDWALGGANVGDPAMAMLLDALTPTVALFAHVDEAGGRAVDGNKPEPQPVRPEAPAEKLQLNVGAADSVPHDLVSGLSGLVVGHGQAALVQLASGKVSFRMLGVSSAKRPPSAREAREARE